MSDFDQVVDRACAGAGADFAFVLTRRGRLVTRRAPRDMPDAGRNRIVRAARGRDGINEIVHLEMPRHDLVPFGGAAPVDIYVGVAADQAILCLVVSTWAEKRHVTPAMVAGLRGLEKLIHRGGRGGRASERRPRRADATTPDPLDADAPPSSTRSWGAPSSEPPPPSVTPPAPLPPPASRAPSHRPPPLPPRPPRPASSRPPPPRPDPRPSSRPPPPPDPRPSSRPPPPPDPRPSSRPPPPPPAAYAWPPSPPSPLRPPSSRPPPPPEPATRSDRPLAVTPASQPPPPSSQRRGVMSGLIGLSGGNATPARSLVRPAVIQDAPPKRRPASAPPPRPALDTIGVPLGDPRASAPDITVGETALGRESLAAIHAETPGRAGSAPEAVRVDLVSISRESELEIAAAEVAQSATGPRLSQPVIVQERRTKPWVESPADAKRAVDAARRARNVPPTLVLGLTEVDAEDDLDDEDLEGLEEVEPEPASSKP